MAKRNYKYDNTVDLSNLPKKEKSGHIKWKESIGKYIPFTFNDNSLCGEFKVVDYKIPDGLTNPHVYLEYQGVILKPILPIGLKTATISQILDPFYIDWKYEIGETLKDDSRDITIIDRFRKKEPRNGYLYKYYKIRCNKCGFDSGSHYRLGEYREEYIVSEGDLSRNDKRRINCPCCSSHIVVPGINDISTTAPWMIPYFKGGKEEASKYTKTSHKKKVFVCPYCGKIANKAKSIDLLYEDALSCVCSDKMSYPNKFAYFLFEKLENQIDFYTNEYSPKWAGSYRYDNYFVKNGSKYIVEMDGLLGHGKITYRSNEPDVTGLKRDKEKDRLAFEHNINMIRINCDISKKAYIWNNIIHSQLSDILNLEYVNPDEIDLLARSRNTYKDICLFWENNKDLSVEDMHKILGFSKHKIYDALKIGIKVGWTTFKFQYELLEEERNAIIKFWNENYGKVTSSDLVKKFNISQSCIISTLNNAAEKGLIKYNPNEQLKLRRTLNAKNVFVYDKDFNFIAEFPSVRICTEEMYKQYGVRLEKRTIYDVCNSIVKTRLYKGFAFSYEKWS